MKKGKRRWQMAVLLTASTLLCCGCTEKKNVVLPELQIGGTLYEPYFYTDIDGKYAGIDVEVAKEACSRMGYEPVFHEIDIAERFRKLDNKEIDCLWSCLTMDGREDAFSWAGPYLYTQRVVAVPADSDIETLSDLKQKRVGVLAGSTSEEIVLGKMNLDFPELRQLTSMGTIGEVFTLLRKGYVDAILGHESSLRAYTEDYPGQYRFLNISLRSEAVGVAFRKAEDPELVSKLDQAFESMREDGTMEEIVASFDLDVQKNVYGGMEDGQNADGAV